MEILKISTVVAFTTFAGLGLMAMPANEDFVILNNPSRFAGSQTVITFDEGDFDGHFLQPFEVVRSYRGVGFQPLGGLSNMPEAAFDPSPPREFGPGGFDGKTIINDLSFYNEPDFFQFQGQGLEVTLPALMNQFGAEFHAVAPGDFTFTLFNGTQQVGIVTIVADRLGQIYNFHAFQSRNAFDRVVIRGPGEHDGRVAMDNLRFAPATDVGLVGYWKFDEGGGSLAGDSSGNGNDGMLLGNTLPQWSSDAAPFPNNPFSLAFDGMQQGSYVQVADAPALDLTETLTMVSWVKPAIPSPDDDPTQGIISKPRNGGTGWALRSEPSDFPSGAAKVNFGLNNDIVNCSVHSVPDLPVGVWSHIAATYEVSGFSQGTVRLYLNGDPVPIDFDCSFGPTLIAGTPLQIGREFPASGFGTRTFHGQIDDARVYNRVLSDVEIRALAIRLPPTIDSVTASPDSLWPPNHKLVRVELSVLASAAACVISDVSSNEPVLGLGDGGNTAPDWIVTGPLRVDLRSERDGVGQGRVYRVTVTCTAHDQSVSQTVAVTVPHDRSKSAKR